MDNTTIWIVITFLALGSFGLRFVFIGLIGDRALPTWLQRHLRYTAVAVLPGLVAPMVMWPSATEGAPDPARLLAAFTTIGVSYFTKNVLIAMATGATTLFIALSVLG